MNMIASGAFECSDVKAGWARCNPCQHSYRFACRTWWSAKRAHDVVPYIRREHNTLSHRQVPFRAVMGIVFHARAPTCRSIQTTSQKSSVPELVVNIAHIGKSEIRQRSPHNAFSVVAHIAETDQPMR